MTEPSGVGPEAASSNEAPLLVGRCSVCGGGIGPWWFHAHDCPIGATMREEWYALMVRSPASFVTITGV